MSATAEPLRGWWVLANTPAPEYRRPNAITDGDIAAGRGGRVMGWRDMIGAAFPGTEPTQPPSDGSCVGTVGLVPEKPDQKARDRTLARLHDLIGETAGDPDTTGKVIGCLAATDIEGWQQGRIEPQTVVAFARAVAVRLQREAGHVPASYRYTALCRGCGPVWLFVSGTVDGCPWCHNRLAGLGVPRPEPVTCGECRHFLRAEHYALGHCAQGEQHGITGNWSTARHRCTKYQPLSSIEPGAFNTPTKAQP